jgi:hypothetical protein
LKVDQRKQLLFQTSLHLLDIRYREQPRGVSCLYRTSIFLVKEIALWEYVLPRSLVGQLRPEIVETRHK